MTGKDLDISKVDIELTSGYEASGCSFVISGAYDIEKTNFSKDISFDQILVIIFSFISLYFLS